MNNQSPRYRTSRNDCVRWCAVAIMATTALFYAGGAAAHTSATLAAFQTPQDEQHFITGVVKDEKGQALPGVTVTLKGTAAGSVTDPEGKFTLKTTAKNGTLEFSSMGFVKQQVAYAGQKTVNITLTTDQKALGEVVVVGYGTQRKVNLVGAVSAIKVDEKITSRALPNASSALSGLVPGLSAVQSSGMAGRNSASLVIRGLGTVNNANPLIVVDGMPDVDINRINMNDIESISVLKDATSASVYGSRAANGVILITTKSGKGQKKTALNFNGTYGIQKPTKAYDFMANYPRALTLEQRLGQVGTLRDNLTFKDGTIDQWMAMGMIDPLRYPNTNWWDIIMRTGTSQNYNLSASGGNDVSNFYLSIGVQDEKGLQINNDYTRYNARFNYDYKLRRNMNTGIRFNGNWSKFTYALEDGFTDTSSTNTAGFDMRYAIAGITPYDPVTGKFGGVMAYGEDPQAYNPYVVYTNSLNRQNRQEANANVYLDWTPITGLTGRVDYSLNYYNQFAYSAATPATAFNFQSGINGSRVYVGDNAGVSNNTATGYKTMLNGRLTYHKAFGTHHDLTVTGVYSEEYWYDRFQGSSRNDRLFPGLHEVDAALTTIQGTSGGSSTEGLRSYIGRINYTAFDRYLFEANFRYDGSSKFLPGHQYGFFPSVALGWRFTEESFLKPFLSKYLTSGKFRASYGQLGNNSGVGRYEQQSTLYGSHYYVDAAIAKGLVYRKMINPDFTWENTAVFNLGLDLSFLDGRLNAELDYYNRLTTGMVRPSDMSILLSGAYAAPRKNIGNLRNKGVELNLNWSDHFGPVRYGVNLNASYNRTSLEKWNEYLGRGYTFLNMPYHFLYAYQDKGIAQTWQDIYNNTPQGASPGDILRKDVNGDGRIDDNDKVAYPNVQRDRPTTNFAMGFNASWKGIDLAFLLQGSAGRKDFWLNNYNDVNFSASRYAASWSHWTNPWSVENRDGGWPRIGGPGGNREESTFWLDNLAYLRLKNIQLGYMLPLSLIKRIGINSFRIYGSAENIATLTSFRGLDPEQTGNRSNAYPLNKSYSIGVNVGL
ncbi:TonB-dependent receptor [Chitinophaga sp. HK235]|uniref:SusC/RagA family TonB-linked outer membrane protein n=1 Tax=Chitinophaga sp. HK235 TaxID=2952571 RepID=UPI00201303F1|nr:TonB-dependent receptor [Chitinophaga sp. HK235]